MGNATSSAMRADDPVTPAHAAGDDGPAFGSLANLGGPRKFKKKPVLVLDPEELEKAHMMFQDASAEMLGEEIQRPERPSSILGLAPMDDEDSTPEDMGAPDEGDDADESDVPSAEDLLRLAAERPALGEDDEAAIAAQLEGLDFDHRIFPNLPLKSEEEIAAEEEAERARAEAEAEEPADDSSLPVDLDPDEGALPPVDMDGYGIEPNVEPAGHAEDIDDDGMPILPADPQPEVEAESELLEASLLPEEAVAEEEKDSEPPEESETLAQPARFEEVQRNAPLFGDAPFLEFPAGPINWRPAETQPESEAADFPSEFEPDEAEFPAISQDCAPYLSEPDTAGEPEPETEALPEPEAEAEPEELLPIEVEPETRPETEFHAFESTEPGDSSDRFEWELEEVRDEGEPVSAERDTQPETVNALDGYDEDESEEAQDAHGQYTEIEDDPVDGYAFMYAANPRARTLHALAEGESNSLRARLIREREQAEAESASRPSLLAKLSGWLRGLFG